MASLNLSTNGPSISKSYQTVVNAPPPTGQAASSPTYGQWALFSVTAPLANAFQDSGNKESVLKVQSSGGAQTISESLLSLTEYRGRVGRPNRRVLGWPNTVRVCESQRHQYGPAQKRPDSMVWRGCARENERLLHKPFDCCC